MAPSTVTKELPLAIPAPKLWAAIMDAQLLAKAVKPVVTSVEVEGSDGAIGSIRTVNFNAEIVGFPYIKEKVTILDESSMTIGASLIEGGYLGSQLKSHSATITVKPNGQGSVMVWVLTYEPLIENPNIDGIVEAFVKSFKAVEAYLQSTN
ncbi:hypothetical protein SELMODRAFT_164509 [Selaginella moellendorffii]|uniref:Bet v I/Major latex protein domain-containing protein n=1 Tax=Selaginella moellendorffii TaxID=88036 RepID=D8QP06_SELML|nr:major pollen allergen Car b 1 isoforms 1A and 1B [Selaginella moellendorffii]XP_024531610.1 major pollen allergen Car b 1 isoforms 1A and 1B [Selaginella moellendorffii]EFJ38847.1 hypothetical protein SELMODRAFT_164509 [Selaginella moellendorffii]|eukprot:XP_002961308.1 major pollen allergen Car b 1 isoforms 1A and 1B [Selaginella moellendorffii]